GGVYHLEVALDHLVVAQLVVASGVRVAGGIGGVHAVDLGGLEQQVRADLHRAQRGGRVGGEERVAGAGREQRDAALLDVADRAAADEILGHVVDLDRAHHAGIAAALLDRVGHRQRVHHGGQHAHVVAGDPVHAGRGEALATEDVAAADHHAHFHAGLAYLDDLLGQPADHLRVDAVVGLAHQRLAGELEQDAAVLGLVAHGDSGL